MALLQLKVDVEGRVAQHLGGRVEFEVSLVCRALV